MKKKTENSISILFKHGELNQSDAAIDFNTIIFGSINCPDSSIDECIIEVGDKKDVVHYIKLNNPSLLVPIDNSTFPVCFLGKLEFTFWLTKEEDIQRHRHKDFSLHISFCKT